MPAVLAPVAVLAEAVPAQQRTHSAPEVGADMGDFFSAVGGTRVLLHVRWRVLKHSY